MLRNLNKKYISSIGYARLEGPTKVVERWEKPFLSAKYKYEKLDPEYKKFFVSKK